MELVGVAFTGFKIHCLFPVLGIFTPGCVCFDRYNAGYQWRLQLAFNDFGQGFRPARRIKFRQSATDIERQAWHSKIVCAGALYLCG